MTISLLAHPASNGKSSWWDNGLDLQHTPSAFPQRLTGSHTVGCNKFEYTPCPVYFSVSTNLGICLLHAFFSR